MDTINGILDRVQVILSAAVTYIILATTVITSALAFALPYLPENLAAQVAGVGATVVAFLTGVAQVIRRVTPVPAEERGVLPPPVAPPAPPTL